VSSPRSWQNATLELLAGSPYAGFQYPVHSEIMRIPTPCNSLLNHRDVRLIPSIVRCHPGSPTHSPPLFNPWTRCRSPAATLSRGAKAQATKKLKELHEGVIAVDPLPELESDDVPQYPTVIQGAKNNMVRFSNCVLITRVGNFYEVRTTCPLYLSPSLNFDICILIKLSSMRLS
jgi:hypothetical protein